MTIDTSTPEVKELVKNYNPEKWLETILALLEERDSLKKDYDALLKNRESLTEIIHRLEGMSANTDTDPRWRAACLLREYQEPRK